jgi:tubby and related proteins
MALNAQELGWANMPTELLRDIIKRVERSENQWPGRKHVVACASVCSSWREIALEMVKSPEISGCLTFLNSLKQVSLFSFHSIW